MQDLKRQVGVMPRRETKGLNNVTDNAPPLQICTLDEAMTTAWPTEALFVPYRPLKHKGQYARCNKPVLPQIRAGGEDLVTDLLVFDYDLPDDKGWNLGEFDEWVRCFADRTQGSVAWAAQWRYLYSTAHGSRIIYALDQNISMEDLEGHHRWVVTELTKEKVALCTGCSDWTHLFRLPYIVRDGKKTWEENYCKVLKQEAVLPLASIGKDESRTSPIYAYVPRLDLPQPKQEEVETLLQDAIQITSVKRRLKNKPAYPILFDHVKLEEKDRNETISKLVGSMIHALFRMEGMSPEMIYALLAGAVSQLTPDADTPDWLIPLWDMTLRYWAKEQAKLEAQKERVKREMARGEDSLGEIAEGMKLWCDHPGLYEHEALEWLKQHLIANSGKSFFVMRADGYYDSMPLCRDQLVARVKITGMEGAIKLRKPNKAGNSMTDMSISEVLGKHSTPVVSIEARPSIPGGRIHNVDRETAILEICSYRRNPDLVGEYNEEVDTWLRRLFGAYYDKGIRWIAWALAFEEGPICALSLAGSRGSGKKMLVQGLSECLEAPRLASADDLVTQWQYGLLKSPFLVVNEGWPKAYGGMHAADKFRSVVGGDSFPINTKGRDPVQSKCAIRVLFTANNENVVQMLAAGRDLSPDDRNALSQRLFHVAYDDLASEYFIDLGGLDYTGREGSRWIDRDGGGGSDFIVARHFLSLYEKRYSLGETGSRFLVEGEDNDDIMFSMMTRSGSSPLILETIIHMLKAKGRDGSFGMVVRLEEGRVFVLASAILEVHRVKFKDRARDQVSMDMIENALKGVTLSTHHNLMYELEERKSLGPKNWHELDLNALKKVSDNDGWDCPLLSKLIKNKEKG
jgi:hypothetical protein